MTTSLSEATDLQGETAEQYARSHHRVDVSVLGRFMLENQQEYPCQAVDMSPGGVSLITLTTGAVGEKVIAYLDHIGRVEGTISRHLEVGFAVEIKASPKKRERIASVLTWLANKDSLGLPEDRRHERFVPKTQITNMILEDGREYECSIIDVSLSGAAITTSVRPAIGTVITIGRMRARVVRHFEEGIGLEFASVQKPEMLEQQIAH
ncbi:PilZ domain-containing protein [Polycladidibacter hongkongensis]|uniref:PilZ domain-containing protein n=1 Tax=Polycladidibacter hongkongensis TaxID=1647556 RepID=UPI000834B323|nr:PilZ domain-containing protein [Pseudovibrio hongkongensis]